MYSLEKYSWFEENKLEGCLCPWAEASLAGSFTTWMLSVTWPLLTVEEYQREKYVQLTRITAGCSQVFRNEWKLRVISNTTRAGWYHRDFCLQKADSSVVCACSTCINANSHATSTFSNAKSKQPTIVHSAFWMCTPIQTLQMFHKTVVDQQRTNSVSGLLNMTRKQLIG